MTTTPDDFDYLADSEPYEPYEPDDGEWYELDRIRRRRRRLVGLVSMLLLVAFAAWTLGQAHFNPLLIFNPGAPAVNVEGRPVPRPPERVLRDGTWEITYEFWYEGSIRTVIARVPEKDYATSESRPYDMEVTPGENRTTWTERYYTRQLEWPEQQRAVAALLPQLRAIGTSMHLGSDDYVRLLNAFVGTIPYDTKEAATGSERKRVCGLLVEGSGVCEEKSMLLGGMLAAEGYDAALLLLARDDHMAVGVRSDSYTYKGTPFAFVDAVGVTVHERALEYQAPIEVGQADKAYESTPLVVPLTRGGARFGSD